MTEYASARDAATRWFGLWDMTLAGGVKSLDMLEACSNVHNLGKATVTTDHPWQTELEERWALDDVMSATLQAAGESRFTVWVAFRGHRIGRRNQVVRDVDALLETFLQAAGMLTTEDLFFTLMASVWIL